MVSHNKEADQTVQTQHFPTGKTKLACTAKQIHVYRLQFGIKNLKENKKGADHGSIAYIPILDVIETTCRYIILSNNIMQCSETWVCRLI